MGAILRKTGCRLRVTQALAALLALFGSAIADLRGPYGFGTSEIGLVGPAQSHETNEKFTALARASEEAEEYFGDDASDRRGDRHNRRSAGAQTGVTPAGLWLAPARGGRAHPPTGPPAV